MLPISSYLTKDGRKGRIRELLDEGWPVVILTRWQSLWSGGSAAGLGGFEEMTSKREGTVAICVSGAIIRARGT